MGKIQILLTKRFLESDKQYILDRIGDIAELMDTGDYSEAGLLGAAAKADVFFGSYVTEPLLKRASRLRLVQIPWTGVDNLDYDILRKFDVPVCNSHSNSGAVAEHAFALLLAALKKIPYHDSALRRGDWNRPGAEDGKTVDGFSDILYGKAVLFIGYGSIARKVAGYLAPFGCRVEAVDESDVERPELFRKVVPEHLDDVLPDADIVFVTVPFTERTDDLLDGRRLGLMKRSAYLVNISRGQIVNEAALYRALATGSLAGAAIDVWYNYPKDGKPAFPSSRYPFHELSNLVMSPHRAGFLKGSFPHLDDAVENLRRLSMGLEPINRVDLDRHY